MIHELFLLIQCPVNGSVLHCTKLSQVVSLTEQVNSISISNILGNLSLKMALTSTRRVLWGHSISVNTWTSLSCQLVLVQITAPGDFEDVNHHSKNCIISYSFLFLFETDSVHVAQLAWNSPLQGLGLQVVGHHTWFIISHS